MGKIELYIDRSRWRVGGTPSEHDTEANYHGHGGTMLLNQEGYMCCLGFAAEQWLGLEPDKHPDDAITLKVETPKEIERHIPLLVEEKAERSEGYLYDDSMLSKDAMEINDDADLSDEDREAQISALFEKHGVEVIFVGDYDV